MPAVAQISINFATILDLQNEVWNPAEGGGTQTQIKSVNPLSVAQYCLHNKIKGPAENYGHDSPEYLSYEGGFISAGDKVNVKYGADLTINQSLNVDTNINVGSPASRSLTITGSSGNVNSKGTISILGNLILNPDKVSSSVQNVKSYSSTELYGTANDYHAINIKDFKAYQVGDNVGSTTGFSGTGYAEVYARNDNGIMKFRRIVGGNNIKITQQGDNIIISNTAPLGIFLDATGLATEADIITVVGNMFPPASFGPGTLLNVCYIKPVLQDGTIIDDSANKNSIYKDKALTGFSVWGTGSCTAIKCSSLINGVGSSGSSATFVKNITTWSSYTIGVNGRQYLNLIRSTTSAAWVKRD